MAELVSHRIRQALGVTEPQVRFFTDSAWARRRGDPEICDFAFGNPHELPLPGFVAALERWTPPRSADWFAYKDNEPGPRGAVAAALRSRFDLPFADEDVFLTNGAFAALAVALATLIDPGDEVIYLSPPWFFYEAQILACGGRPVRVALRAPEFDLDPAAIAAAIGERTRAIIVNSPNNPSGRVYPREQLEALARVLGEAGERRGRPIFLLSDEAYSRIVYDERPFLTPTAFHPHSLLLYTYGKVLLTPGQRLGYIALAPAMPAPERLREALYMAQVMTGYAFPNALLQHALADLEALSIDIAALQRKRDRMVDALAAMGYEVNRPEGTFYLLVRSPIEEAAFIEALAARDVFCLPGATFELPGYFRISLTASEAMIERALPRFADVLRETSGAPRATSG